MDINEIKLKAQELRSKILYHNMKYYNEDSPEISDYEYDMLLRELEDIEKEYPQLITADSPTQRVGGEAAEKFSPVEHKVPMESLHDSFSHEEIRDFARILSTIRKTGGNTIEIIKRTTENISSKIDIKEEIGVMIAAKRLEQKIMTFMPMILLLYLRITNGEYVERLYRNPGGVLVMSGAIVMILFADHMGRKIIDIKI